MSSKISILGYDLLGQDGVDGIRYAWSCVGNNQLLESAAFPQHRKGVLDDICGYTTSVSMGCILTQLNLACKFCRTGAELSFYGNLSASDIAKQNVFMVLSDINCSNHREYQHHQREFAYMGQGEPGYSYVQIREAIELTNIVMNKLDQSVYRHIISTAGVPEMIKNFKEDIQCQYYTERVTLHFSLHATEHRKEIMPIDGEYSYRTVLEALKDIRSLTGEKPCIGILLFSEFASCSAVNPYSNDLMQIKKILGELSPRDFRLSFCEFNIPSDVDNPSIYDYSRAQQAFDYALNAGFDAKLFSSFGRNESTACGMLSGKNAKNAAGAKWTRLESEAEILVSEAKSLLRRRGA